MKRGAQVLTERFERALLFATRTHARQTRKGTEIPYVSHLLAVASLVLEDGGDEDEAIAALLHDAGEDQGVTYETIASRFGQRVAEIVRGCSDADSPDKGPWKERKVAYLDRLEKAESSVLRVSAADKLHNARAILRDYRTHGHPLWSRFNAGRNEILWYYTSVLAIFRRRGPATLARELDHVLSALRAEM